MKTNYIFLFLNIIGFNAKVFDLEDFSVEKLINVAGASIFLMATYGEGEPTDNAVGFYKWLKNSDSELDVSSLSSVKFSVFGLGNRQYEHFNKMGKVTDKFLAEYGATRVFEYGEGDDDGTLEEDFDGWKAKLWPSLVKQFHPDFASGNVSESISDNEIKKVDLQYTVEYLDKSAASRLISHPVTPSTLTNKAMSSTRYYFTAVDSKVIVNKELRSVSNKEGYTEAEIGSTRHIELDLSEHKLSYITADNLAVIPTNDTTSVTLLAKQLGYELGQYFKLVPIDSSTADEFKYPFPFPTSVREVLTSYVDIHGAPKHATLTYLLPYISDETQKVWLTNVLAKENRKMFVDTIEGAGKSIYELLTHELSSCKVPLADLLHIAPSMQPRYYTISSSSSVHPSNVHITVSVTNTPVSNGKVVPGLCSTHLRKLDIGNTCKIFIRSSSFKLPPMTTTPIIMIGPGTGIAPMRALLQEREYQHKKVLSTPSGAHSTMKNVLYFGCKKSSEDFIYSDELRAFEKSGTLTTLHLAFSRESTEKVYVQHLIKKQENASSFVADLEAGAYIYVCGATKMGEDVMKAIHDILKEYKKFSKEDADKYIKNLQSSGRYVQELWTA